MTLDSDDRCTARLPDESCCAGRCIREDQHEGKCRCKCGTEWGYLALFEDEILGGFRRGLADTAG